MKIQEHTFKKDFNGISAGVYAWFTDKKEALKVSLKGCQIIETTPGRIFRARIK